ncbi:MAG: cobaltochelatase subunit CobN [Candidatus Hodgkinia cicadicola]
MLALVERLSFKLNFKALVVVEGANLVWFYYNWIGSDASNSQYWLLLAYQSALFLNILANAVSNQNTTPTSKLYNQNKANEQLPLRYYANNAVICAYNISTIAYQQIIADICNKLLLYRIRSLQLYVRSTCAKNELAKYKLVMNALVPFAVISLTSFANTIGIDFHRAIVFQLATSRERLSMLIGSDCGLTQSELCSKQILPEIEGKVFTRAVGFASVKFSLKSGAYVRAFTAICNRLNFVIGMLLCWLKIAISTPPARALVFVLFNYPVSDSKIGNGVGLNTIASVVNIHNLLTQKSLLTSATLINELLLGVTNYSNLNRITRATAHLQTKRCATEDIATTRLWGKASIDPFSVNEFASLSICRVATTRVMIQPTRGYGLVNPSVYHSAFVIPCRLYWLSYIFCKRICANSIIINVGKHGSLEWLPGRANALSRFCYPELIGLGLANLYYYIVNDPGEGTQAKRRTSSVIIDHFTPPITSLDEKKLKQSHAPSYLNFKNKYYCNLLGLQFRSGLHSYGAFEVLSTITSLSLLLSWRLNLKTVRAHRRARDWNKPSLWLGFNLRLNRSSKTLPTSEFKKPILLAAASCFYEVYSTIKSTKTRYVLPGLSSAFSRADRDVLPTGRNFFSKDVLNIPTPWAYSVGISVANKLIRAYYKRSCCWLRSAGVSVWATSNMRTGGDDVAIILALIGIKPIWKTETFKVVGFEVLPLKLTRFLRVNVLVRASGMFRDAFCHTVDRLYKTFEVLSHLNEANCDASLVKCYLFSSRPGYYGTGIQELLDSESWSNVAELAKKYVSNSGFCYNGLKWEKQIDALVAALATTQVVLQSQDNREHDILDSDDYYQFEGGMNVAVRHFRSKVCAYHADTSKCLSANVKVRRLKYEIDRVLKCKLLNKNWILSVLKHGYRGASEIVANFSYFYNFAITSSQTSSSQFRSVYNALIADSSVRTLIALNNTNALIDIKRKMLKAICRGVWSPVSNRTKLCLEI